MRNLDSITSEIIKSSSRLKHHSLSFSFKLKSPAWDTGIGWSLIFLSEEVASKEAEDFRMYLKTNSPVAA